MWKRFTCCLFHKWEHFSLREHSNNDEDMLDIMLRRHRFLVPGLHSHETPSPPSSGMKAMQKPPCASVRKTQNLISTRRIQKTNTILIICILISFGHPEELNYLCTFGETCLHTTNDLYFSFDIYVANSNKLEN